METHNYRKELTSKHSVRQPEFVLTPYKIYVSLIIDNYWSLKDTMSGFNRGRVSRLLLKLTQSLDIKYQDVREMLSDMGLLLLRVKCDTVVHGIKKSGMDSIMDLIESLKEIINPPDDNNKNNNGKSNILKTGFLGLFIRRVILNAERQTFTSLSLLHGDFMSYINGKAPVDTTDPDISTISSLNDTTSTQIIPNGTTQTCPKQMQYFFAKQLNLIEVDERKALNPRDMSIMIEAAVAGHSDQPLASYNTNLSTGVISMNDSNDLNFVKYINCLRMKDYHGAREALISYFDSSSGSQSTKCWAAYNLASLQFHFGHYDLAVDAIRECISSSQESSDDNCLEFSLLLLAKLILKRRLTTSDAPDEHDLFSLLTHLQNASGKLELPFLSALASLHMEQILGPVRKSFIHKFNDVKTSDHQPEIIAVKNSLNNILLMSYANRSGHFLHLGYSDLSIMTSQAIVDLYAVESVGGDLVYCINENTAIGLRNVASNLWRHSGLFDASCDMLAHLASSLFSPYRTDIHEIWKKEFLQINFDHHLNRNNLKEARIACDSMRMIDLKESMLKRAELLIKKGNQHEAYELIKQLLDDEKSNDDHLNIRILMLKSQLLKDVTILLRCIETSKSKNFHGLHAKCLMQLAQHQLDVMGAQNTQAKHVLRKCMNFVVPNGSVSDVAKINYLYALCQYKMIESSLDAKLSSVKKRNLWRECLDYNQESIEKYNLINDVQNLMKSLTLQTILHDNLGNSDERNFCAKQVRILHTQHPFKIQMP